MHTCVWIIFCDPFSAGPDHHRDQILLGLLDFIHVTRNLPDFLQILYDPNMQSASFYVY